MAASIEIVHQIDTGGKTRGYQQTYAAPQERRGDGECRADPTQRVLGDALRPEF